MTDLIERGLTAQGTRGLVTTFRGDRAEYTGKAEVLWGGLFFEVRLVEGRLKNQLRLVPAKARH